MAITWINGYAQVIDYIGKEKEISPCENCAHCTHCIFLQTAKSLGHVLIFRCKFYEPKF